MRGRLRSPCEDSARIMYVATLAQSSNREGIVSHRRYACAVARERTRRLRGLHPRGRPLNLASCRQEARFSNSCPPFRTEGLSLALQTSTAQLAEPLEPRTDRHLGSCCWFVDTTSLTGPRNAICGSLGLREASNPRYNGLIFRNPTSTAASSPLIDLFVVSLHHPTLAAETLRNPFSC